MGLSAEDAEEQRNEVSQKASPPLSLLFAVTEDGLQSLSASCYMFSAGFCGLPGRHRSNLVLAYACDRDRKMYTEQRSKQISRPRKHPSGFGLLIWKQQTTGTSASSAVAR